ncbi:MAG: acetylglutamate kinase [Candidatus Azobacteroides sp.]|nr:acetylglutamate kinase [Candidatus Azobacteroides sp.]
MTQLTIVKVGGKIVEDTESLKTLIKNFSLIAGYKILVHGGGRLATLIGEKLGIKSQLIDGRRVTDEETLKVATMVYAGLVNKNIVAQLQSMNMDAIGLTGADMNLILSVKRPVTNIDYGFVGDIVEVNAPILKDLLDQNYIPVLAPITHDGEGHLLNTNADSIANEVAKAMVFDFNVRLIFCFEKRGVLIDENDDATFIPTLNFEEFEDYKQRRIIQGGMIPKLENAFDALGKGVKEVFITRISDINTGKGTFISK